MPYGVGGALAEGLQSGFQMGRQVDLDRAKAEQQKVENEQRAAANARAQRTSDLAAAHSQLVASRENLGALASEGAGYLKQYGSPEAIPVDIAHEYAQRSVAARKAHQGILDQIIGPVQDQRQQAQDLASKMATGQADPLDPKIEPATLVKTLTATARRPVTDFMGTPDAPAPVKQMVDDFRAGMQTQNEGLTLKALNGLFAPELKTGVGQPSPHGGVIVGKQIVKILPAPPGGPEGNDPNAGKVTPVLRVFVRQGPAEQAGVGESQRMASNEQQQYGAPPGATGHYDAPVTQNRSTDPNDPIAHISMEDAMQRISQMETLATAMDHPELRAKVEKGLKEAGSSTDEFLNALYATGGAMPTKQETYENVHIGPGAVLRITHGPTGKETGREMITAPGGAAPAGPVGKKLNDIKAAVASGALTPEEGQQATKVAAGIVKVPTPKVGKGTGLGGAAATSGPIDLSTGKALSPADQLARRKQTVDFYATQSLSGDNSWQVGLARGKVGQKLIEDVKDRIPQMAGELGLSPQDVGTNKAQNAALTKTLADRQKYVTSVEQLNGTLTRQGDLVKSLLAKGGATEGGPLFNKPLNALKTALGDTDFAQLQAALIGLAREHQRVLTSPLSNAQLHAAAAETGDKLVNANMPPKTIIDLIDNVMKKEAQNGLEQGQATLEGLRTQLRSLGKGSAKPAVSAEDNDLINKWLKK